MNYSKPENLIPAEAWFQAILPLLRDGYKFKICPQGRSMVPFLAGGRDEAVLSVPGDRYTFKVNDVVLIKYENGLHVLHRICRINNSGIYTLGDGNTGEEGPFKREEILAIVDYIIRKGDIIRNDDRKYLFLVNLWRAIRPFRPAVIKGYATIRRLQRKVTRGGG